MESDKLTTSSAFSCSSGEKKRISLVETGWTVTSRFDRNKIVVCIPAYLLNNISKKNERGRKGMGGGEKAM